MPRYVVNESEDDSEPKTARRTRATLAASTTDSPIRRSTRIRHTSVNPDGSSPESVTGATAAPVTTRVTRSRAPTNTGNTLAVPEPTRALRSRKNSASSNVSENPEIEAAPSTPKTRTNRRLSAIEPSPSTPRLGLKTRRSTRASSETKSPVTVVRATRRTRASSIDPEPIVERAATPTKKRRQQISALPSEPALAEEANEDKASSKIDKVVEVPELEIEDVDSPEKTPSETSRRSSLASAKKLSKNDSAKEQTDEDMEETKSLAERLPAKSLAPELSSPMDKSENEIEEEDELLKTPVDEIPEKDVSAAMVVEAQSSPIVPQSLVIKTKRNSIEKSKELGMKIEDLLNKSTEEQETSPGNKENQKLNVIAPDKVKKNIEFAVSNVNVSRGKSIGSIFVNKSSERKINTSLDERVLSKSRYEITAAKSIEVEVNKSGKKSQAELPGDVKSPKKNGSEEVTAAENTKEFSGYTKIDETVVENEVIEEFSLYDSNDDSKSEFSLTVEDDDESEKVTSFSNVVPKGSSLDKDVSKQGDLNKEKKSQSEDHSDGESNSDSDDDIFEKPNPSKINSRKNSSEIILREKKDTPARRFSLNFEEPENRSEDNKSPNKSPNKLDKKRKSIENKETDTPIEENKASEDGEASNLEIETNAEKNIDEEEPMDTNEHEEMIADKNSPGKQSSDKKEESSKLKESKSKSNDQVSDSDSNAVIDSLFHNISAEEWSKKQKSPRKESGEEKEAFDSDDTVILKQADSAKKTKKNRRSSSSKMIVEEVEGEEKEIEETAATKKSPKKSRKSNTSMENKTDDQVAKDTNNKNLTTTSLEQGSEIDDNVSEADTIPTNIDQPSTLQDGNLGNEETEEEEEKSQSSAKNTPKNAKNKSPVKSAKKSRKSDVYKFEDSFEGEEEDKESEDSSDEEETTRVLNPRVKSLRNKKSGSPLDKLKTPLGRNYSIVAVVDSDSGPDMPSSDNSEHSVPGYLFNAQSSDEEESPSVGRDESHNTIDSDIARELNLAGDTDLKYSDDDVPGDECRASESEHSDEEDEASDFDDFIVKDDEVESSEYSEEESKPEARFKRILRKSSSEEEVEAEETEESDEEMEVEDSAKKLDFSLDSNKTLSDKKSKKRKSLPDSAEKEDIEKSDKKLNKSSKPLIKSLLNSTIDLCTPPVQDATTRNGDESANDSPGLNTSAKNKSLKKLKKCLVEDLGTSTPEGNDLSQKDEEDEPMVTPKTKTPSKEKKTPKSARKDKRDSIQQIEETATLESELTQEEEEEESVTIPKAKTPSKDKKTPKSARKDKRDSIQQIEDPAILEGELTQEEEEEESVSVPKTKTPNDKDKKTPKSARKNKRDSIQMIEEIATPESELTQEDVEKEESVSVPKTKTPNDKDKKTPKSARKNKRDSIQMIEEVATLESELTQEDDEKEESVSVPKTKTPNNKEKKTPKSARKNKRDSIQKTEEIATLETELMQGDEEEEATLKPKEKTPSKEKKTPRKNARDSIQLIEEAALVASKIFDLNKSMLTPNSESPVTKFLKKERLNESLPPLELKKRASRSFDKKALSKMTEAEQEAEEEASETEEQKEIGEESEGEESDANEDLEENGDEFQANGHNDDEEEDETDEDQNEEEENEDSEENENELEDEESEESSEEEEIVQKKARKSAGRKSLSEAEEPILDEKAAFRAFLEKKFAKRQNIGSTSNSVGGKSTESDEDSLTPKKKKHPSNTVSELVNRKKRGLESSDTPQGLKKTKKMKIVEEKKPVATLEAESDSDEAPESLGFEKAREEVLQGMKEVAALLKASKEAKKKKRRDLLERIRQEKEAKAAKKQRPEVGKNNLKRLPDDLLENLSDAAQRPQKKRKLLKKEEQILPSRYMFSPKKQPPGALKIEEGSSLLSTGGGTTLFSVVNLEKVKKQPQKAAEVASFRERMLARNPRQPVSAYLMYQVKQKASGKHQLPSRKQT